MLFFLKRLIKFNLVFNGRSFPTLPPPNNIRYDLKEDEMSCLCLLPIIPGWVPIANLPRVVFIYMNIFKKKVYECI